MIQTTTSKNHIKEVAEMLGVEIREEFYIEGVGLNPYHFTSAGLMNKDGEPRYVVLGYLLSNKWIISHKRWRPREGEVYYFIDPSSLIGWGSLHWNGDVIDQNLYEQSNCFKTKEEVLAMLPKIKQVLKEGYQWQ